MYLVFVNIFCICTWYFWVFVYMYLVFMNICVYVLCISEHLCVHVLGIYEHLRICTWYFWTFVCKCTWYLWTFVCTCEQVCPARATWTAPLFCRRLAFVFPSVPSTARLLVLTNKCKQRWKHYNAIVRTRLYDQLNVFDCTDSTICRPSAWCPLFQSEESSAAQKVYQQLSYWKHKGVQDIF